MKPFGFTMIELLVVVAIVMVVLALLMPSFRGAMNDSERRKAQVHAAQVRLALNTALAQNPQLTSTSLGTVNCTAAADIGAGGVVASAGGNGWDAAAPGSTCTASGQTPRTYRVTVTLQGGQAVTAP